MMTLFKPTVEGVLALLYAQAEENDRQLEPEEEAAIKASGDGRVDGETLASIQNRTFMAGAPDVGGLFYILVRTYNPSRIVEFGTSFGLSALHLAAALRDTRSGHLITTKQSSEKASR